MHELCEISDNKIVQLAADMLFKLLFMLSAFEFAQTLFFIDTRIIGKVIYIDITIVVL